jgi:hypothetical protein
LKFWNRKFKLLPNIGYGHTTAGNTAISEKNKSFSPIQKIFL